MPKTIRTYVVNTLKQFEKSNVKEIEFDIGISPSISDFGDSVNEMFVNDNSANRIRFKVKLQQPSGEES